MTERVGVIARVRALAVGIAKAWMDQQFSTEKKERRVIRFQSQWQRRRVASLLRSDDLRADQRIACDILTFTLL